MTAKPARQNVVSPSGASGLEIAFATKELRRVCESDAKARKVLGAVAAEKLKHRLADFLSASNVAELPRLPLPATGDVIDFEIADGVFMSFRSNHNRKPVFNDGGTDWTQVTRIQVLTVGRRQ